MFGRATITLGTGPHSSFVYFSAFVMNNSVHVHIRLGIHLSIYLCSLQVQQKILNIPVHTVKHNSIVVFYNVQCCTL